MKHPIVSREYKVMLKSERFAGSPKVLLKAAGNFWKRFAGLIEPVALDVDGRLDQKGAPRVIRFYDTADQCLHGDNYIFRERIEGDGDKREATLKFRHPDRYISEAANMLANGGKMKFEEDIKSPFMTFYSFSTTQKISKSTSLSRISDVVKLYPRLEKRLTHARRNERIEVVGNFSAREMVITNASFDIARNPKVEAECALIVWYDEAGDRDRPVVVEFSFRYGSKQGEYGSKAAQRAFDVFGVLWKSLPEWVDSDGPTKTAYVYSRAGRGVSVG